MHISHLFAGKPQAFGRNGSPSSIIKKPYEQLNVRKDGAIEDEQGNKKLHGGPYMALHQFAQSSYPILAQHYPLSKVPISIGSIGENLSAPNMHENNVYIGDKFKIGSALIEVVSPRAPCSKINTRYGVIRMDTFVADNNITGWYYSVLEEGVISLQDKIELVEQAKEALSVSQIWQLRKMIKSIPESEDVQKWLNIADAAIASPSLAPEWQAFANRAATKLAAKLA